MFIAISFRSFFIVFLNLFYFMMMIRQIGAFVPLTRNSFAMISKLKMSTSSDQIWRQASIVSNIAEAVGLRKILVQVDPSVAATYIAPGQYVQIKTGEGKPGFYAIASPPSTGGESSGVFTFLIKENESNLFLTSASTGSVVDVSAAMGKGFNVVEYFQKYKYDFPVTNVLMLACGSGLAPIASAIDSGILGLGQASFNSLFGSKGTLYLGVRSTAHIPLKDRLSQWEKAGIRVVPVLSKPEDAFTGRRGYVQDILRQDGISVPRNSGLLLCGQRLMVEDVKRQCLEAGVFEGRVLLNF